MSAWTLAGTPASSDVDVVTVMDGTTFAVSDLAGDMREDAPQGLFVRDTRVLGRWDLTVDRRHPRPMTLLRDHPFSVTFVTGLESHGPGEHRVVVVRRRLVGNGMREEVRLENPTSTDQEIPVVLAVGVDFADLFEVKEGREPGARALAQPNDDALLFTTSVADTVLQVRVTPEGEGSRPWRDGVAWEAHVPAHGAWRAAVEVEVLVDGVPLPLHHRSDLPDRPSLPLVRQQEWRERAPRVRSADPGLIEVTRRSVEDLGILRIFDPEHTDLPVVAAGAPWFMALFGRDSLLTALMTLPFDSSLALGTLTTLAARQGATHDLITEEQPGKILHEVRFGPAGVLALGGSGAYYGCVDATPLFVVLLGELVRWRGLDEQTAALVPHADRALAWMDEHGDRDGDDFLEYQAGHEQSLANQGWKDSWDAVSFADGHLATGPIALVEVQGYAYAAMRARAELALAQDDARTARYWVGRARVLKHRFNEAFWIPGDGRFALALDGDKQQVDALASNIGHCLWAGVVDRRLATAVAETLVSEDLSSGWGLRTLGASMGAYDPLSYHNGSVWPHDTALAIGGLARYGFADQAGRLATDLMDAAAHFQYRLPELFAGFARDRVPVPVPYPAACSPQAWASAAPLGMLGSLLGLNAGPGGLGIRPRLPQRWMPLTLDNVVVRGRSWNLEVPGGAEPAVVRPGP